jgi:hypothetical protein
MILSPASTPPEKWPASTCSPLRRRCLAPRQGMGRIGQAGTVRTETHPDAETAAEALARQISVKRRRGYTAARGAQ